MAQMILIKSGENIRIYEDGRILIMNAILSYPHLDKKWSKVDPKTGVKPPEKFSAKLLLPKDSHAEAYEILTDHIKGMLKDAKVVVGKAHWCIKDGDDSGKPEDADRWTINASENRNVILRDQDKNLVRDSRGDLYVDDVSEIAEMFKPGYIVDALIRPWIQDNDYGKKVNSNLVSVRLIDDTTEVLGGGSLDDDGAWDDDDDDRAKSARGGSTVRGKQNTKRTALDDDDDDDM